MAIKDWFKLPKKNEIKENLFYEALFQFIGGQEATYDRNGRTYIHKGYLGNPDVYSVISQRSKKLQQIPYAIKEIDNKDSRRKLEALNMATKGIYDGAQRIQRNILYKNAYKDEEKKFPLERPNPTQSWEDVISLYETFMAATGNAFFYVIRNSIGEPLQVWVLPSHMVSIVIKNDVNMLSYESPIDYFQLTEGNNYIKFYEDEIIHIKYPNPNFDLNGSHLYGLSPLVAVLSVLEASNELLNQNVKTAKNGGVFGFISGKDRVFTSEQATQLKQQMKEMDRSPERLSRMASSSVPVEFTKLSLNTEELKPFDYLNFNQKQICNVLGWDDVLLNSDENSAFNNTKTKLKAVVSNTILPDAKLFAEAFTHEFIRTFRGYENCVWDFDHTELPEMQEDVETLVKWLNEAPVTLNEFRTAIKYESSDQDGADSIWINSGKKRIDEVGITETDITKAYNL